MLPNSLQPIRQQSPETYPQLLSCRAELFNLLYVQYNKVRKGGCSATWSGATEYEGSNMASTVSQRSCIKGYKGYKDGLQPESLADGNWLVKQNQPVSKIETKSDTNLRSLYES